MSIVYTLSVIYVYSFICIVCIGAIVGAQSLLYLTGAFCPSLDCDAASPEVWALSAYCYLITPIYIVRFEYICAM